MRWNSLTLTIAAGTAIRLANISTKVQRLRITPLLAASGGVVYVLTQNPATAPTPDAKSANNFITELSAATATVPGQMFSLDRLTEGQAIDLLEYAIDGAHTGDPVQISWELP